LVVALVIAAGTTGCGGKQVANDTTGAATTATGTPFGPPAQVVLYGHIESLDREGDQFVLLFDPAWFLSGETANAAAAEDGAVEAGEPVPNDNYVVDEGHRLLTYLVPDDALVTVLTTAGDPAQFGATEITVSQLAGIVQGTSDLELFESLETGVWISVDIDTVRAINQQYRP
jgi:hypothetical protein